MGPITWGRWQGQGVDKKIKLRGLSGVDFLESEFLGVDFALF